MGRGGAGRGPAGFSTSKGGARIEGPVSPLLPSPTQPPSQPAPSWRGAMCWDQLGSQAAAASSPPPCPAPSPLKASSAPRALFCSQPGTVAAGWRQHRQETAKNQHQQKQCRWQQQRGHGGSGSRSQGPPPVGSSSATTTTTSGNSSSSGGGRSTTSAHRPATATDTATQHQPRDKSQGRTLTLSGCSFSASLR